MSLLINGLFAQSLRLPCEMRSLFLWGYAQKIILGISNICLWLFFSHALILNENPLIYGTVIFIEILRKSFVPARHRLRLRRGGRVFVANIFGSCLSG